MLELRDVTKVVGAETHIRGVSMTLQRGSLNVLLGPTRSGKTSLMRLMAGLDRPATGDVLMDGRSVVGLPVQKRNVAMVYQQFINYPTLTVYENIASPLRVAGRDKATIEAEVRKAAHLLKLEPYLDRTPLELSGGQQQRTALARALVKGADLVLLDEPLANLDYKLREELRAELPRIFAESGTIFVYATTEPTEALLLGGNTATLSEGLVTQFGPTIEVFNRPSDLVTARTFSDPPLNTLQVEKRSDGFHTDEGRRIVAPKSAAGLPAGRYVLGFRPHHLYLDRPGAEAVSLGARVAITEITGSESFIHLDHAGQRWVALAHGVRPIAVDSEVTVWLVPERLFVFGDRRRPRRGARHVERGLRGSTAMARITLDGIAHSYQPNPTAASDWALKEIDHVWENGQAYALLGPSGCGKTTLLNLISGLLTPSHGRIRFGEQDVTDLPPEARNIAQVFQFPVVYDTMSVYDNLAFPLRNRRVPEARSRPGSARCSRSSGSRTRRGARPPTSPPTRSRRSRSAAASCAPTSRRSCSTSR